MPLSAPFLEAGCAPLADLFELAIQGSTFPVSKGHYCLPRVLSRSPMKRSLDPDSPCSPRWRGRKGLKCDNGDVSLASRPREPFGTAARTATGTGLRQQGRRARD